MSTNIALIPSAGCGSRFGTNKPKQYTNIGGLPILLHTLRRLSISEIDAIYIILSPEDRLFEPLKYEYSDFFADLLHQECQVKHRLSAVKIGGSTRAESVLNALNYLQVEKVLDDNPWVLVHDSVRCCLARDILQNFIQAVHATQQGAILAEKVVATVKQVDAHHYVEKTVDRNPLWLAQTPQMFLAKDLINAYAKVSELDKITDEASLFELAAAPVRIFPSDNRNLKITTPEDVHYAEFLLERMKANDL